MEGQRVEVDGGIMEGVSVGLLGAGASCGGWASIQPLFFFFTPVLCRAARSSGSPPP